MNKNTNYGYTQKLNPKSARNPQNKGKNALKNFLKKL